LTCADCWAERAATMRLCWATEYAGYPFLVVISGPSSTADPAAGWEWACTCSALTVGAAANMARSSALFLAVLQSSRFNTDSNCRNGTITYPSGVLDRLNLPTSADPAA